MIKLEKLQANRGTSLIKNRKIRLMASKTPSDFDCYFLGFSPFLCYEIQYVVARNRGIRFRPRIHSTITPFWSQPHIFKPRDYIIRSRIIRPTVAPISEIFCIATYGMIPWELRRWEMFRNFTDFLRRALD